jgi:DNA-binding transcriptional ArsR family regulator
MVKYLGGTLNSTFAALADPTRRAILARLARGETSVTALAQPFLMSLPAVTKHLRVLDHAGLIEHYKEGRVRHCRIHPQPLKDAAAWLSFYRQFWERQFDALGEFVEEMKEEDPSWQHRQDRPRSSSVEHSPHQSKKSSRRGQTRG